MFEVVAGKKMNLERARQARGRWSRDISEIANIFKGVGDVGDFFSLIQAVLCLHGSRTTRFSK